MGKSGVKLLLSGAMIAVIAAAAHGANAAYCRSLGDDSQKPWDEASDEQKLSAILGVEFHLDNPDATDASAHENWMAQKLADGWVFGEVKDEKKKTHPCLKPFADLPAEQQFKDALFRSIVRGFADHYEQAAMEQAVDGAASADNAGLEIELAEAKKQVQAIAAAIVPLGKYLESEGALTRADNAPLTVDQIADAALQALRERNARTTELTSQVEELTPEPDLTVRKVKTIKLGKEIDADKYQLATTVLFAGDNGQVIAALPPITMASDKFVSDARGRTLNADIDFPVHGPAASIASVFLLDDKGKAVSQCALVMPLNVSGGRTARINAGSLLFPAPEEPEADDKAKAA